MVVIDVVIIINVVVVVVVVIVIVIVAGKHPDLGAIMQPSILIGQSQSSPTARPTTSLIP